MPNDPGNPNPNSSFSTILPTLQLAVDSTSLDALKKCPRYYQYSIIQGYALSSINAHLKFGTVFHKATELYAHDRAQDLDHETALLSALRCALIETWDFKLSRPWVSEEPTKTRNTLLRSIVWYLDKFKDENLKTLILATDKPAVELSFRFDSGIRTETTDEAILLCGHLDRVVEWNEQIFITDKKTTKNDLDDNYFKQYTPNNQVSLYSIAGVVTLGAEIDGLIIDGCQILVTGSRFRRRPISRSAEQLEEWMTDLRFYIHEMENYAQAGYWPMRESSCGFGRFQCAFRPVCSAEPQMRQTLLDSMYVKRIWDPLQPR